MRVIYLHGFASSPASRKARLFLENLKSRGLEAEALTLAPDFERLTISGQLAVIDSAVHGDPATLIGSSLGGYLAALYASRHPEIDRLILLAPAFDFHRLWTQKLGPDKLQEWRENGTIPVFNYGLGREAQLGYQLLRDAEQYPPFPEFSQPCLVLHGLNDDVVPFANSAWFAAKHLNVKLVACDSGHELTDVLDEIWKNSSSFLFA